MKLNSQKGTNSSEAVKENSRNYTIGQRVTIQIAEKEKEFKN